jgi:hypothetical protein
MSRKRLHYLAGAVLILLLVAVAACSTGGDGGGEATAECPEAEPCPECEACKEPAVSVVPFEAAWAGSPHADAAAEAFNHWNEEDPREVPTTCAKCHSTPGFLDFLGEDGSEFGVVNAAAPIGTVITCEACHNDTTESMTSVVFPSGVEITGLGPSARCMQCHQGRASSTTVDEAIAEVGLEGSPDTPNEELGFVNIHYYAAAASLFGSEVHGGYEYPGQSYQMRFAHVEGYTECVDCHDQHTLEVQFEECAACHTGVTAENVHDIRMNGSLVDYDGDGDTEEGIYYEIEGLRELLYTAMQAYANDVIGMPIAYNEQSHPYFFIDTNGNGEADDDESVRDNAYNAFSPRLLQAAYNYQVSLKDPGAFAHNAKYHIALLYDSIASLNEALGNGAVDLAAAHRNDAGHFDATAEAFRHWDEEGAVPGSCSRCHSAEGLPLYVNEGVSITQPTANAFSCTTCHDSVPGFTLYVSNEVTFPSGTTLTFGEGDVSNLCMNCHQGRSSTVTVDASTEGIAPDTVDESLGFINIHYFAAGATLFGSEAQGAYQYPGKTYAGRNTHVEFADTCAECHNVHALEVNTQICAQCHHEAALEDIRVPTEDGPVDYDGDGNTDEGIAGEIETIHEALWTAIEAYAADTIGEPIAHGPGYPYYFDEAGEGYSTWTPRLVRAVYNYQYVAKDPGAFAHNRDYVLQILYDSLEDIGGSAAVAGMTRP